MNNPVLADAASHFKTTEEGVSHMCKIMEELQQESMEKGMKKGLTEGAVRSLKSIGASVEQIIATLMEQFDMTRDEAVKACDTYSAH